MPACPYTRSARSNGANDGGILGAQNDVMQRTGPTFMDHSVRELRAQVERDARAKLGDELFAEAFASGSTCSIDALLADIDRAEE